MIGQGKEMKNVKIKMENDNSKLKVLIFLCFGLFVLSFSFARAATLFSGSASQTVSEGQSFVIEWYLDTQNEPLNLLNLQLNFSSDTLRTVEASKGSSVLSLWLKEPAVDNETGSIQFTAGAPGGFNGSQIPILRTAFLAKKTGRAQIALSPSSQALRNDGRGMPADLIFTPLVFVVSPPGSLPVKISSPTHPDQNKWSKDTRAVFKFSSRPNEIYSYSFSQNIEIIPDNAPDEAKSEYVYENLPDGLYYFRLNSRTGVNTWQEAGIYRVQIDRTAPEDFVPIISSDEQTAEGERFVSFAAVDKTSGISHYEIESWPLVWKQISSPYILSKSWIRNDYSLRAFDVAGNYREVKIPTKPIIPGYMLGLLAAGLLAILVVFLRNKFGK